MPLYDDRRGSLRAPIGIPFFVSLQKSLESEEIPALLVDCGNGGVQLAFPPTFLCVATWLGCEVRIDGLPLLLDARGSGHTGTICWVNIEHCGVRFHIPLELSDDSLLALAEGR